MSAIVLVHQCMSLSDRRVKSVWMRMMMIRLPGEGKRKCKCKHHRSLEQTAAVILIYCLLNNNDKNTIAFLLLVNNPYCAVWLVEAV